jgi:hypothetical protein
MVKVVHNSALPKKKKPKSGRRASRANPELRGGRAALAAEIIKKHTGALHVEELLYLEQESRIVERDGRLAL